jgi:hypothetical protein
MSPAKRQKGWPGARRDQARVLVALDRLHSLERDISERLIRVEENLRLLRQDLLGNGQPGRISRLEIDLHQLRAESLRQRGILAGISFVISSAIALLSQFLFQ